MGETLRTVIIDTYALMAKATGEITSKANACLEKVRRGKIKGIIHPVIAYEFLLQFYKGRTPIFEAARQALDFLETHFSTVEISYNRALKAAEIKFKSDAFLAKIKRSLSACDALTIAIAKETRSQILTGDRDLRTSAERENITVIW